MKGFNVKKLAAVGAGAVLIGAALASVTAAELTKSDLYSPAPLPVVVGSTAALSDAVWAGNIATALANKAYETNEVTVSGNAGSSSCTVGDIIVDLTVGGTTSYSGGAKEYKMNLNSAAGQNELDANVLTDAQLNHLYNTSLAQKVNNGDQSNQSTTPTITEKIGLTVDAKMDTSSDVKDMVAYIESGNFYYQVFFGSTGSGNGGIDLGSTSFTDSGSDDKVQLVFFGEEYELSTAALTGTKNLKMVKTSARETYNEGETITGLLGRINYDGQDMEVKVAQIAQYGTAVSTYQASFELYDSNGTLIDSQTVTTAANLRDEFVDAEGDYVLGSNLYVDVIAVGATTGVGYVEITKGTNTVELYDTKGYPYDSTDTTGIYDYTVTLTTGADGNNLAAIKISNSRDKWNNASTSNGVLYPTASGNSLAGHEGTKAYFGQAMADGTAGKDHATVEFEGFETGKEMSTVEIGKDVANLDSSAKGGISFPGADDTMHYLPLALEVDDAEDGSTFSFDTKTIWYDLNYGTSTSTAADMNALVTTGDYVNGRAWTINDINAADYNITVGGVQSYSGVDDNSGTCDRNGTATFTCSRGDYFYASGVKFTVRDVNISGTVTADNVTVSVDGSLELRQNNSTGTLLYNTAGDTADQSYGKLFFTEDVVFDSNTVANNNVPLKGNGDKRYYYAVNPAKALNRLWFMLDGNGSVGIIDDSGTIQNSHIVNFNGTNIATNGTETNIFLTTTTNLFKTYYVPKDTDFNSLTEYSDSTYYLVAWFTVDPATVAGDFNVFIDTANGGNLGPYTNSNLSVFSKDADYNGTPALTLTSGTTSSYYQSAWTDTGSKIWLLDSDAGTKITMPETRPQAVINVLGKSYTTTTSGGEELQVANGETGTTSGGTSIAVSVPVDNYSVDCGTAEAGDCAAEPETYASPMAVSNLVYLDNEAPAGAKIIVGGPVVNLLAVNITGLADRLTASGDVVMEKDEASGNVVVAGYTADDTVSAARELIAVIKGFE